MGYDLQGRLVTITDPAGKITQYQYGSNDNLTEIRDALNGVTRFDYLKGPLTNGNLLEKIHDAKNQTTAFGYDSHGRLTSVTNPVGQTRNHQYNEANQLIQITKPDGTAISFEYDKLGHMARKNIPGNPVTYEYDAAGNLTKAEDNGSLVRVAHDVLNRPIRVVRTNKSSGLSSQNDYEYDANGNRTKMSLQANPQPLVWTYAYDNLNSLAAVTNPQGKTFGFIRDALGRRTNLQYPNGIVATYAYDDASQLTSIRHRRSSDQVVIASATYTYDNAGNRTGMMDQAGTHNYVYDDIHRLVGASHPAESNVPVAMEIFSYDAVENRMADSIRTSYVYSAANRLVEDSLYTYAHDANGNLALMTKKTGGEVTSFAYDAEDRLITIEMPDGRQIRYEYDALGLRIEREISAGTLTTAVGYIYDGANILATADGSNNVVSVYTNGARIDEPLGMRRSDGIEFFLHADAVGSISAHSDTNGVLSERIEYSAYGLPVFVDVRGVPTTSSFSHTGSEFAFTAREFDSETGLYFFRARYYAPLIGRFLTEDAGELQNGTALYAYVGNNPIRRVDPMGTNWGETIGLFSSWYYETGPDTLFFGPETNQARDMKGSYPIEQARKQYCQSKQRAGTGYFPAYPWEEDSGGKWFAGPRRAGLNSTQQFVGGFTYRINPLPNGSVMIVIENTTSLQSLLGQAHSRNPLVPRIPRGTGRGGDMRQFYYWTEDPNCCDEK